MREVPVAVSRLLDSLLTGIRTALGDNFVGAYVCGSLALGNFDPETSDIDVLIVTERRVSDADIEALRPVHERVSPATNVSGRPYEAYYVDRQTIRRFEPGQQHLKAAADEPFYLIPHRQAWVFERWAVREHGIVLAGPEPKTLIDPVSADDLRSAAASDLATRLRNWSSGAWPMEEIMQFAAQLHEVETVCRALYTIGAGKMISKRAAVT